LLAIIQQLRTTKCI